MMTYKLTDKDVEKAWRRMQRDRWLRDNRGWLIAAVVAIIVALAQWGIR